MTPKDQNTERTKLPHLSPLLSELVVQCLCYEPGGGGGAGGKGGKGGLRATVWPQSGRTYQAGIHISNTPRMSHGHPARATYLALPRHADGRAILVTGGTVNDLLSLPDIEAVAHRLAVQFTLPIALYYQKKGKTEKEKKKKSTIFFLLVFFTETKST